MLRIAASLCCWLPLACAAARIDGVVSHVTDGDTVWVRPASGGPPQSVRIDGIDAPEICQEFGAHSRDALAALVLHKTVTLTTRGSDDYHRIVARVKVGRADVGAAMVTRGYAWSYRFRSDPGPYGREERRAREARRGLWAAGDPEPPRNFRVRHGRCIASP